MQWRLIAYEVNDFFENMAIDEAIFLEASSGKVPPTLRFYGSSPAAVSIGYFQDIKKEVNIGECNKRNIGIVRRITGGKAVFHCDEITYSVAVSKPDKMFPADIAGTYHIISKCIVRGLAGLGIEAYLAEDKRMQPAGHYKSCCFSMPSKNELLVDERKICGSAQIRKKDGFLQHGSLLLNFSAQDTASLLLPRRSLEQIEDLNKAVTAINDELTAPLETREICRALENGFANELGIELAAGDLSAAEKSLKKSLAEKYKSSSWNLEGKK
ncbi:MAG TPA: lipoate--protein ligase family protein [Deltaproteobacteria bacterium]|nr:lipoate--protein ligase family protein [Deltaproteobacteria bacterium]